MTGAFDDFLGHTYRTWKEVGGCSIGEMDEMLVMEALGVTIEGLQESTLREIISCGDAGAAAERTMLAHFLRERDGSMEGLWD